MERILLPLVPYGYGVLLATVLCGCAHQIGSVPYIVDYPFSPETKQNFETLTEVTVDLTEPEHANFAPQSLSGFYKFNATVILGSIPMHENLKAFRIVVREHVVTREIFNSGGGVVTMCFNQTGKLIMVKEFSQAQERLPKDFPK